MWHISLVLIKQSVYHMCVKTIYRRKDNEVNHPVCGKKQNPLHWIRRDYDDSFCFFSRVLCRRICNFTVGRRGPQEGKRKRGNSPAGTAPNATNGPFLGLGLKTFRLQSNSHSIFYYRGNHIFLLPLRADYFCNDSIPFNSRTCSVAHRARIGLNAARPQAPLSTTDRGQSVLDVRKKNIVSSSINFIVENELLLRLYLS